MKNFISLLKNHLTNILHFFSNMFKNLLYTLLRNHMSHAIFLEFINLIESLFSLVLFKNLKCPKSIEKFRIINNSKLGIFMSMLSISSYNLLNIGIILPIFCKYILYIPSRLLILWFFFDFFSWCYFILPQIFIQISIFFSLLNVFENKFNKVNQDFIIFKFFKYFFLILFSFYLMLGFILKFLQFIILILGFGFFILDPVLSFLNFPLITQEIIQYLGINYVLPWSEVNYPNWIDINSNTYKLYKNKVN